MAQEPTRKQVDLLRRQIKQECANKRVPCSRRTVNGVIKLLKRIASEATTIPGCRGGRLRMLDIQLVERYGDVLLVMMNPKVTSPNEGSAHYLANKAFLDSPYSFQLLRRGEKILLRVASGHNKDMHNAHVAPYALVAL